ncbi:MAG: hypothetical protein M3P08_08010 [Thermoproteota archaeon]|nr:hypothetical protein [Thermoproteota archaeon]
MNGDSTHPLIAKVNSIVPLLNGSSDSTETIFFLGPKFTKIHRYLITLYMAKHVQSFSLLGVRKDGCLCFTLYRLARIAKTGFKNPIHYDRTKVAIRVYEKSKELGYVDIKKDQGETYITTTEEGDEVCRMVLDELLEFAKIHSPTPVLMNEVSSKDKLGYISKGIPKIIKTSPLLRRIVYNQLKTTHNLNKQFGEAILALDE